MATNKTTTSAALFLALNLLFFAFASACGSCPTPATPSLSSKGKCPVDTLKLGVCANVLNGLINLNIGKVPKKPCCSLIENLVDLDAAVCLCTAIKANVLGIKLNVPVDLSLLLNYCGKKVPEGYKCA